MNTWFRPSRPADGSGAFLPHFISPELMLPLGSSCIFFVLIGSVMVLPWLVRHLVNAASGINNITLLTIGITSIFMITTMSLSTARSLTEFFSGARFDVRMWTNDADRTTESRLRSIPGVHDLTGVYDEKGVNIADSDDEIQQIQGINGSEVESGTLVMVLHDTASLVVEADLPEEFVRDVNAGDAAVVIPVADPDRSYAGIIIELAGLARLVNGENVVKTRVSLESPDDFLREGFNVDVEIRPAD